MTRASLALALSLTLACAGAAAQDPADKSFSPQLIRKGADLYEPHCSTCHGIRLVNPEWAPVDLRKFPLAERARFIDTVTHGVRGMPPWGDLLKPEDIEALWAYVVAGERKH